MGQICGSFGLGNALKLETVTNNIQNYSGRVRSQLSAAKPDTGARQQGLP